MNAIPLVLVYVFIVSSSLHAPFLPGIRTLTGVDAVRSGSVGGKYSAMRLDKTVSVIERALIEFRKGHDMCPYGFAMVERVDTGALLCVNCSQTQAVVGLVPHSNQSQRCVQCGGDNRIAGLRDATYVKDTGTCACPQGYQVVEFIGTVVLVAQMCAPCADGDCNTCTSPLVKDRKGRCVCAGVYVQLDDGSCVLPSVQVEARKPVEATTATLLPVDTEGGGIWGPPLTCENIEEYSADAAVRCEGLDKSACNMLANLCVFMNFDEASTPCRLYDTLFSQSPTKPYMPPLYYGRDDTVGSVVLNSSSLTGAPATLTFVVARYDLNGILVGKSLLSRDFKLCNTPGSIFTNFFVVASNRELRCSVKWEELESDYSTTQFFELFLVNPFNVSDDIPIPLVVDDTDGGISPSNAREVHVLSMITGGYKRRFYMYGRGCTRKGNSTEQVLTDYHVTTVRRVVFVFNVEGPSIQRRLKAPAAILQLASTKLYDDAPSFSAPSNDTYLTRSVAVLFTLVDDPMDVVAMRAMVTACVLCFCTAWMRTFGWMRRRQNMILNGGAAIRFLVYFCDHSGNMFALITLLASWYLFFVYKFQDVSAVVVIKDKYVCFEAMMYVSAAAKGIAVLFAVIEQCNADYFVIDWERSKGQLLRENRVLPVSMWRSTFVANELNGLQVLRQWHPLFTMVMMLFFLSGLNYVRYAESVPIDSAPGGVGVYQVTTLRFALVTLVCIIVFVVVHVLEFQFYYRFVCVHPLQSFVDLCSVSNISVLILPEEQWGYYIHGESIHAHSDVSMEEFQQNLCLEAQGDLPVRGLGGQSECQTFEVFMGVHTRQYLYVCSASIEEEQQRALGKPPSPVYTGKKWHFLKCLFGVSRKPRAYDSGTLALKKLINDTLRKSIRRAEGTLLSKSVMHGSLDIAPNVLYMNGPQSGDKAGKDVFFVDDVTAYGKAFLYGIDIDLFIFYMMLYASVDVATHNLFYAFAITFAVEFLLRWYRMTEGVVNISSKTLIDDRFFI
ncbi:Meckelin (Transmembrane protein 67), putative [Trypanosoma equiperdum]|uniref:Meckelin (Transmembrane protein 67), putative n=1 Tax=Trypanosoma equiperdum TaxID=5694 RepID=A0A1G4HZT8_TRYEQ|nr:Meckelin (Transmembrane protein 67), putative [Trypanosoma equiperdum]